MLHSLLKSFILISTFVISANAQSTTFWGAVGQDFTDDGSVLIAVNRDDLPSAQSFTEISDEVGYGFTGLFSGRSQRLDSGINEKGVFATTITAASVSIATRRNQINRRFKSPEGIRALEWIMRNCASVNDALNHPELFRGYPINFILADHKEIAIVESTPKGTFTVQRKTVGALTHTNHYTQNTNLVFNETIPQSTEIRLTRINSLLDETTPPYTMPKFIEFTTDAVDGPDFSLFRTGSKPLNPRTLSSLVVKIPARGSAKIYLRYQANPLVSSQWTTINRNYGK